jgi:hypothetical protein
MSELPAVGPRWRLGKIGGIPLDHPALHPSLDRVDLIVAQPPLADDRKSPRSGSHGGISRLRVLARRRRRASRGLQSRAA